MEALEALASFIPELVKLGGWGVLVVLLVTRILITKKEKDESEAVCSARIADKDKQIELLQKSVADGDKAMEKLAVAWEAAIDIIMRERSEHR